MSRVVIAGVGMTDFRKTSASVPYQLTGEAAARAALQDAGIEYGDVDMAVTSYLMGDTCAGQAVIYRLGLTGIPVFNTNNACASGSSALYLARQAIAAGEAGAVLVVGFEEMRPQLQLAFPDRLSPVAWIDDATRAQLGPDANVSTTGWFAGAAREYMSKYGYGPEPFAHVAAKAHRNASRNPRAAFGEMMTPADVMASKMIVAPLTKFACSAPTSGAAAAVLTSEAFAKRRGLRADVKLVAQEMRTDFPPAREGTSMMSVVGYDMAKATADALYRKTGIGPDAVQVAEIHDCFASNEVISYEALGFVARGDGGRMALAGEADYGGRIVVNPSGGLMGKGHPIGATGVAQCAELTWQLRGEAGARQVEGARVALQHNLGLGGACVVGLYMRD